MRHPPAAGKPPDGLLEAVFDSTTHHLVRVEWKEDGALTTLIYGDYRVVAPGLVVPFQVQVQVDGVLVESLNIEALTLSGAVEAGALSEPG